MDSGSYRLPVSQTFYIDTSNVLDTLQDWLADPLRDNHLGKVRHTTDLSQWTKIIKPSYVPKQKDDSSSGISMSYLADYLELGRRIDFTQKDIEILRMRTLFFLKRNRLAQQT